MLVVETAACEISSAPASIPHNLPTIPAASRGQWFMSALSTDDEFVFINATSFRKEIRTLADGWTRQDAEAFYKMLMSDERATVE